MAFVGEKPDTNRLRTPPHNLEAERSVLGAILVQNDTVDRVREVGLEPSDFYLEAHQKIFEVACFLSDRREPVDLVTLSAGLRDRGWFDLVGGTPTLTSLFDDAFHVGNVSAYARELVDKSILRKMIGACSEIITDAFQPIESTEDFLDQSEGKVFAVSNTKLSKSFTHLKEVLKTNLVMIEQQALKKQDVTGLSTGFKDFDRLTGGLQPGQTMVIAARPGMGKTSLVLSMLQHVSIQQKGVVAFFSLEMAEDELGFRLLSSVSQIDSQRLKIGKLVDRDWHKLAESADKLAKARVFIDDSGGLSIMDIRSRCRRMYNMEKRLDLIVVDYLQLMKGTFKNTKGGDNREREIAEISRGLKQLAKELKVPIIVLSQLNRGVENRQDKRPSLADLRESGAIEQDADMVCFIYRDEVYNRDSESKGIAEFIIAKNRSGPTTTVKMGWQGQYTRFVDLAQDQPGMPVGGPRPDRGDITL